MTVIDSRKNPRAAKRWWREDDDKKIAGAVFQSYRIVRKQMGNRRRLDRHHMAIYGNMDVAGNGYSAIDRDLQDRIRYNLCQSIVDTAASVIAQQRPKPQYLTSNGDFGLQRQARLRTQVLEGQLYETKAYEIMPRVFIDGAVVGTGIVYGYLDECTGEPKLERVSPLEVWVDKTEAIYGEPRTIYRTHLVPRDELLEGYTGPGQEKLIENAGGPGSEERKDFWLNLDDSCDQVLVIESWRLPYQTKVVDKKTKKSEIKWVGGKHVMALSNGTLVDEEWEIPRFPMTFYRWSPRQIGFWGMGLVERTRDAQWRINQLIASIRKLSDLGSNLHVFVKGEKFRIESFDNDFVKVYKTNGDDVPQFIKVEAVPLELFQQLAQVREEAFSQEGVSAMEAEGKVPDNLQSGRAQLVHEQQNQRRHIMNARGYEDAYLDLIKLLEMLNEKAFDSDKDYTITARSRRGQQNIVRQVKWDEVRMPEAKYRLQMFPTSALPTTPEGKWATVQQWIAAGFVTPPFAQQLLDFPDLDTATRIQIADLDYAMWQVEEILDGYEVSPIPYQDLQLAADIARKSALQAEISGAPEDVLEALRKHTDNCLDLDASPKVQATKALNQTGGMDGLGQQANQAVPAGVSPGPGGPMAAQGIAA